MDVYLAENLGGAGREVYGIFGTAERAKEACQEKASEFFGEKITKPLHWMGDESYVLSASYQDPGGYYLFMITRFTIDERRENGLRGSMEGAGEVHRVGSI